MGVHTKFTRSYCKFLYLHTPSKFKIYNMTALTTYRLHVLCKCTKSIEEVMCILDWQRASNYTVNWIHRCLIRQVYCNCAQLCLVVGPHLPFSVLLIWWLICRAILSCFWPPPSLGIVLSGHAYLFLASFSKYSFWETFFWPPHLRTVFVRPCLPLSDLLLLWVLFCQAMLTFV